MNDDAMTIAEWESACERNRVNLVEAQEREKRVECAKRAIADTTHRIAQLERGPTVKVCQALYDIAEASLAAAREAEDDDPAERAERLEQAIPLPVFRYEGEIFFCEWIDMAWYVMAVEADGLRVKYSSIGHETRAAARKAIHAYQAEHGWIEI